MVFVPGLKLSQEFYREIVRPILDGFFPGLEHAAALIDGGSEVLGFDDETSVDHHWGPRLMLFLSEQDHPRFSEQIRQVLADQLPYVFKGYPTNFTDPDPGDNGTQLLNPITRGPVNHRVSIQTVHNFFSEYLDFDLEAPLEPADWLTFSEQRLRTVTTGAVFHDEVGLNAARARFAYYPRDVWIYLLAAAWRRIGQEEHLMGRAGIVADEVGSALIGARLVRDVMRLCFLMEKTYAPYPKWFGSAFKQLASAQTLWPILQNILRSETWQARESHLVQAYQVVAALHNALKLTRPLPENAIPFYGRPFKVIALHGFAQALLEEIRDPQVKRIAERPVIGSLDLFSDNVDLIADPSWRATLRHLFEAASLPDLSSQPSSYDKLPPIMDPIACKSIVVKLGTSTLTAGTAFLSPARMVELVRQVAQLHNQGCKVLLVSSGAMAAGRERLAFPQLPKDIPAKQMLSAVGQPRLMALYEQLFDIYKLTVAQVLLTRSDLADRSRYLNSRNTLTALLSQRVIPIVNENDTVATEEIRVGDNDNLSALVANLIEADLLVMLTDQPGLFTADPRTDSSAELIQDILSPTIPQSVWDAVGGTAGNLGTGGMLTKLQAADLARRSGTTVVIAAGDEENVLTRLAAGEKLGTRFSPLATTLEGRKRYILAGGNQLPGVLAVDAGAARALRKGSSLLPVGVKRVTGGFDCGDTVKVVDPSGSEIARGLVNYNAVDLARIAGKQSKEIEAILGTDYDDEVIHRNNLVLI